MYVSVYIYILTSGSFMKRSCDHRTHKNALISKKKKKKKLEDKI